MTLNQLQLKNRSLQFFDQGSGAPIVFVHGFPLDHTMWKHQFQTFAKTHRVIAPDLPGFGGSEPLETASMEAYADSLAEFLDALGVDQPVAFCGLSMGGYIGWQFWKRHPGKLKTLIACDTRAANDSEQVARARGVAAASVLNTGSIPVADAMVEKLFWESADSTAKELVYSVISATSPQSIADGQLAMSKRMDATDWLKAIQIPVLFIVGEHDGITPPDEMKANSELVSGSIFHVIKNAGHMAPLENPDDFNAVLVEFMETV